MGGEPAALDVMRARVAAAVITDILNRHPRFFSLAVSGV
jgi:hypothetical protein